MAGRVDVLVQVDVIGPPPVRFQISRRRSWRTGVVSVSRTHARIKPNLHAVTSHPDYRDVAAVDQFVVKAADQTGHAGSCRNTQDI
jgi:hypothetical protein